MSVGWREGTLEAFLICCFRSGGKRKYCVGHRLARAPSEYAEVNGTVTCAVNMASSMGTASGTDIPVEHLDYSYIEKCTNVKEIEKILRVLR